MPSLLPRRSSSSLPPLLNTAIDSSSLSLAIGLNDDDEADAECSNTELHAPSSRESSSSPQPAEVSPQPTSPLTPVTSEFRDKSRPPKLSLSQPEPLQPQLSDDSFVSVSSPSSYRRLSLWKSGTSENKDWARDVLSDLGWSPAAVEHSITGNS
jgi:hypothetical protein